MKRILHFENITFKSSYNWFKIDIHQQLRPQLWSTLHCTCRHYHLCRSTSSSPSPSPSSSDVGGSDSGVWARRSPKPNWYTGFIKQSRTPYWEKPNNRIPLLWLSAWTHLSRRLIFLIFLFGTKNYMHMSQFKKLYNGSIQGLIIDQKYWERKHNTFFLELLYQHFLFIKEHLLCAQINDQG